MTPEERVTPKRQYCPDCKARGLWQRATEQRIYDERTGETTVRLLCPQRCHLKTAAQRQATTSPEHQKTARSR